MDPMPNIDTQRRLLERFMQALQQQRYGGVRHEIRQLNAEPALLGWHGDTLVSASWIDDEGERITAVQALRHPGKLARLAAVTKSATSTSLPQ